MKNNILLAVSTILILAMSAFSQGVTGNLEGFVLDSEGVPIGGVKIAISGSALQGIREATTDDRGHFFILILPVGTYMIKVQHPVFQEATVQDVSIRLGKTTSLGEIRLKMKVQDAQEITVTAERPVIDSMSTSGSSNLEVKIVETLPVKRDYRSLTLLLPHAVESFANEETNLLGATGLENKYFIDGIETTDPFRGVTGTRLPYNFIKEIEVKTGGYEAEYRSSLGGIINVITSSGGNEFSGRIFGFLANNRFSGDPRIGAFKPRTGDFSQYDFGISLGGPIIRDKLWFFAAYNPAFEQEEVEIPGQGFFLDKSTTHIFAGKLTWQAAPKTNIMFTVIGDPSIRDGVGDTWGIWGPYNQFLNPDPFLEKIERGGINLALKGTHIVSDKLLLEVSLSRISRKEQNLPATDRGRNERAFIDGENSIMGGGSPGWMDDVGVQTTADLIGTWMPDKHTVKAGLAYRENKLDNSWTWSDIERFSEYSWQDFYSHSEGILRSRIPSFFIQDSWEATRRLRLNFGLRWDGQYIVATNGKVSQRILGQYQPRIGILYQPGEIGTQKIFGSFGRFYEELMLYVYTFRGTDRGQWGFINYDHDPRIDPSGGEAYIFPNQIQAEIEGLQGQHYDEFTLGYERLLGKNFKIGVRGIYRALRQAIEDGVDPVSGLSVLGNPGSGPMSAYPKARREYTALEVTTEKFGGRNFNFFVSYVLSRNYGNYTGLGDYGFAGPNAGSQFDQVEILTNALGWLPNDRTHVFKFSGSFRWDMGLTVGTSFSWQSGTPRDEWGGSTLGWPYWRLMRQRGSSGRTSSIFDLNVRLMYELSKILKTGWTSKIILDVYNIGSRRTPIEYDQVHYFNLDENGYQTDPNPTYGLAVRYFPPMSARLGFEIGF